MKTLALVESPAQLVNVVEWAHHLAVDAVDPASGRPYGSAFSVVVLAPSNEWSRVQLRHTAALARHDGVTVTWCEPRLGGAATARMVRALAGELAGVERLVVGDPFSGVMQVVLSVARAREVVVVDDGTATLEFARQWRTGEHLTRWHQVEAPGRRTVSNLARDQLSDVVRRRLSPRSGCDLTVFSCLPVDLPRVAVLHNTFAWLRHRYAAPRVKASGDLVGTSLVETGVVQRDAYLSGVAALIRNHAVGRYFAHRKEADDKLDAIRSLGVEVVRPPLPLEVVLRAGEVGRTVVSFPSTVVHTLPLLLADTPSQLLVSGVPPSWLTAAAPAGSSAFLDAVTSTARSRYGLAAA